MRRAGDDGKASFRRLLQTAHEFTFQGCDFFNSGANGLYINGSSGHVITSNRIGTSGSPRVSDAGATSFIVKGNDCRGNGTGAVNNLAGTSSVKVVADNIFEPQAAQGNKFDEENKEDEYS